MIWVGETDNSDGDLELDDETLDTNHEQSTSVWMPGKTCLFLSWNGNFISVDTSLILVKLNIGNYFGFESVTKLSEGSLEWVVLQSKYC